MKSDYRIKVVDSLPAQTGKSTKQAVTKLMEFLDSGAKYAEVLSASTPAARYSNLRQAIVTYGLQESVHVATRTTADGVKRVYLVRGTSTRTSGR
jgi:hypothetical protein